MKEESFPHYVDVNIMGGPNLVSFQTGELVEPSILTAQRILDEESVPDSRVVVKSYRGSEFVRKFCWASLADAIRAAARH